MAKDNKETYLDRMIAEGKALRAKTYALDGFLQSSAGQAIPAEKRLVIDKKLKVMRKYSDLQDELIAMEK